MGDTFWRFEDYSDKGILMRAGSGTIGGGTLGSCSLREHESTLPVEALHKTMSMPMLGPHAPTGRRVGDDLGMLDAGDTKPVTPPLRRKPKFAPELEDRL